MLNSAAGVMFPSAIAPPISTIRSMPLGPVRVEVARDVRQRARRHERDRRGAASAIDAASTRRRRSDRLDVGGGQRRPVEPALAVDVRGDGELALERPVGAHGDRDVRPADEREHPQRVLRRLVERLVPVHGRDAEQVELGAREREQQRDRIVVAGIAVEDDRRRRHGAVCTPIALWSSCVTTATLAARRGSRRSRPRSAETAARRSATPPSPPPRMPGEGLLLVAPLEERDEQACRERVAGGGAVDRLDAGGAARATSSPSSSSTAPSAPSVSATRPSRRRAPRARAG